VAGYSLVGNTAAATIGFVHDYTITEGINSSVSVEIQVLEGELSRSVEVAVFTVNNSAAGIYIVIC
jgi:hypothetical protein